MFAKKHSFAAAMFSFRLWTIFYVFALLAAAMATFGPWGIIAATLVLSFWTYLFRRPQLPFPFTLFELFIIVTIVGMLVALLLPSVQTVRESSRSTTCLNNLKQLGLALLDYEASYGQLPPPYTTDSDNQALLSWRVLILPRVDRQDVFDMVQFDQSWNGPANSIWSSTPIDLYCCPSDVSLNPTTNYFAVVGPQTAWPATGSRRMGHFKDGRAQTILLIEAHERDTSWAKPEDISFEEAVELLTKPMDTSRSHRTDHGFFYKSTFGRSVLFADGHVALLNGPLDRRVAEALLTLDGGEMIDESEFKKAVEPQLDYAKCYGFAMFVLLSLLPAAWIGRRRTNKAELPSAEQPGDA